MELFNDLAKKLVAYNLNKHHYARHIINGNLYCKGSYIYMKYFEPTIYDTIDTNTFNYLKLDEIKNYTILSIKGDKKYEQGEYGQYPFFFSGRSIIKIIIDNVDYYLYLKFKIRGGCETCDGMTDLIKRRFIISKNLTNLLKFIYTPKQARKLLKN